MSAARDELLAKIRHLEIKAGVQRGHLETTEKELQRLKRQLQNMERKQRA